ncbi:MAG: chemotaxis response regulator protein-glutamate methylesterase [Pirellula sp.]|jgi:two-component system chemotaxis response regulator CheB|nr:chemotaxis response regulator protein-glutamate methylesterase [Pirellula sp.]
MPRKIQVLIVDDSVVIRRMLSDSLATESDIEVAGVAANGRIALAKIPQLNPDVVTLDIEMPEMNGLETLTELRRLYPKLPVIMFSTLTQRGAEATLEALSRGASDYVTKPANVGSVSQAMDNVRRELAPKIKGLCTWYTSQHQAKSINSIIPNSRPIPPLSTKPNSASNSGSRVDIVVVGVSTGGPNALQSVLPKLPDSFPVPILVVQHMPPIFTNHLASRLDQLSKLNVREARQGEPIGPGGVWIAPGDFHMTLRRDGNQTRIALNQETPENSCRPAVDVLFRSASELYGPNVLSVVLTGMGQDGLKGCETIRSNGGQTIAQDAETSVVWGMPGAVTNAGLAQRVLPLSAIAEAIQAACVVGRSKPVVAPLPSPSASRIISSL